MLFQSHTPSDSSALASPAYPYGSGPGDTYGFASPDTYGFASPAYPYGSGPGDTYGFGSPAYPYGSGPGDTYGFGAAALVMGQGKDFNCNAAICFGAGANDALFKRLQQAINVLSKIAGITPIVVDGFIGKSTVTALQAVIQTSKFGLSGLAQFAGTKEAIGANAPTIVTLLEGAAVTQQAIAVSTGQPSPLAPKGTPQTFQPPTPSQVAVATQQALTLPSGSILPGASAAAALPQPKTKTLLIIAGAAVAVLAVGGIGYVMYRRKAAAGGGSAHRVGRMTPDMDF
jgi:lysozyme family protein